MPTHCPSTERLVAALQTKSTATAEAELAAHLADCTHCQVRLQRLAGGSSWMEAQARQHRTTAHPSSAALQRAIQDLEAQGAPPETVPPAVPPLEFLQPSDQAGVLGRFGPYQVLAVVAVGGMGIVLKARDPALARIVALKLLPPTLAANSLARARFIREARAAAAVVHEHVVPIYAVDKAAGLPYLVMQFVQGRTLADRIKATGPLPLEEILRIGAQSASGLAAAHAQGLIHRDVKPGNILLENSIERVRITDFGLARAMDDASITRDGHVAGTPEYMSPEQADGGAVDARSDLFGLGCVLYEMATGISPFRADNPLVAMRRVCTEVPPPAQARNPGIPKWLSDLIQRLMAKDAAARPASGEEVAAELARGLALTQQGGGTQRPTPQSPVNHAKHPKSTQGPLLTLILVLALGLVFAWGLVRVPRPAASKPAQPSAVPASPPQALYFVPPTGDAPARGFATLAAAIAAADSPAVVECRFDGLQVVETVLDLHQPLILRAAPGFEPVLTPMERNAAVLVARAPLVLEGLTIVTRPTPPDPDGEGPGGLSAGIMVEAAPFLAVHCRFEIQGPAVFPRRRPKSVRLVDVPDLLVRHCEFSSPMGTALEWVAGPAKTRSQVARLESEGCTARGVFLSVGGRSVVVPQVALQRNTFQGDRWLSLVGEPSGEPVLVTAHQNVFAVVHLLWTYRARASPVRQLIRWQGGLNVYDLDTYAAIEPAVTRHEDWHITAATAETNSVAVELGLRARGNGSAPSRAVEAAAFTLSPKERKTLVDLGGSALSHAGADPARTGPGQPYNEWRATAGYQAWLDRVRDRLSRSTPPQ
jgi:serine/threonine protein kinase